MFRTKVWLPVINTENGDFSYDGEISTDDIIRMQDEQFMRTNRNVERFVSGQQAVGGHDIYDPVSGKKVRDEVDLLPMECVIQGARQSITVDEDFFAKHRAEGKMFIVRININPNMDRDAESELRFWLEDSMRILKDKYLDERTKLKSLPKMDLKVDVGPTRMTMSGCKIVENICNRTFPYYFAIIVEKLY